MRTTRFAIQKCVVPVIMKLRVSVPKPVEFYTLKNIV